jgi:hypothetical protein
MGKWTRPKHQATGALSRRPLRHSILFRRVIAGVGLWLQRVSLLPVPRQPSLKVLDEATDDIHGVS